MGGEKKISLTMAAHARLRGDILACRLRPGQKLNISDICAEMGFSLGAIREALARLCSEGLVEAELNKGFRVTPITLAELADLTRARCMIECQCLERAILCGDLAWETGIVSSLFELSRRPIVDADDPDRISEDWVAAHERFHTALTAACDSSWLLRLRDQLYAQSERYRSLSLPLEPAGRNILAEHDAIANAAIARNLAAACAAMTTHLNRTTEILIKADVVATVSTGTDQPG